MLFFSYIHDDEIGYSLIYHLTYDQKNNKIISVDHIGTTGGDGGHYVYDIFNFKGDTLFRRSISTFDTDLEKGYIREFETIESKYIFGNFKSKAVVLKSESRLDTIHTDI